ncbi:hypothetical protein RJ639_042865 [Escallonia herrerae]|uniref:Phosphoglycerate mutase n=1 Tax=Escallonia herrerae TaxID=1293975 RepID=A0AA88WJY9_9ASTE|nr:hypothetical protein RJ639_042865 [Escallonia herrerae]
MSTGAALRTTWPTVKPNIPSVNRRWCRSNSRSSIFTPQPLHLLRLFFFRMGDSSSRLNQFLFQRRLLVTIRPQSDCSSDVKLDTVSLDHAEIIVIRHGETPWNADGRIQGHLDVELNDMGKQQAAAVAERLSREPKFSIVYSSDLKRAAQTAEMIANSCGGLEVIKDPGLRERHLGDLQGLVSSEVAKVNPKAYQAYVSQRRDQEIPGGGESLDQLYERCTSSLQRIGNKHKGERVVVVTHGGVIRAFHKRTSPRGRPGKILNTSVNVFHLSEDEWTIKAWGDVSHLIQTGFLKSGFGGDRYSG